MLENCIEKLSCHFHVADRNGVYMIHRALVRVLGGFSGAQTNLRDGNIIKPSVHEVLVVIFYEGDEQVVEVQHALVHPTIGHRAD